MSVWADHFIHHLRAPVAPPERHRPGAAARVAGLAGHALPAQCLRANVPALAFYAACGFVEIGAGSSEDGEYLLLESGGKDGR